MAAEIGLPETGSMTVPNVTSPGRSGFGSKPTLSYIFGSGNALSNFRWSLSLPYVTYKSDKGLPRCLETVDSYGFILSDVEHLVPVFRLINCFVDAFGGVARGLRVIVDLRKSYLWKTRLTIGKTFILLHTALKIVIIRLEEYSKCMQAETVSEQPMIC